MKNNSLPAFIQSLAFIGCFSCSRPVELLPPTASLTKIALVYQPTKDFYSAMGVPESQVGNNPIQPTTKWGEGDIALFSGSSKAITYLLNNKPTNNKEAVKAVMRNHTVRDILVNENEAKTQRTVVINYTE